MALQAVIGAQHIMSANTKSQHTKSLACPPGVDLAHQGVPGSRLRQRVQAVAHVGLDEVQPRKGFHVGVCSVVDLFELCFDTKRPHAIESNARKTFHGRTRAEVVSCNCCSNSSNRPESKRVRFSGGGRFVGDLFQPAPNNRGRDKPQAQTHTNGGKSRKLQGFICKRTRARAKNISSL